MGPTIQCAVGYFGSRTSRFAKSLVLPAEEPLAQVLWVMRSSMEMWVKHGSPEVCAHPFAHCLPSTWVELVRSAANLHYESVGSMA